MPGITDPSEEYFKDGQWGWDGTQWRKLALAWGYSDTYAEHKPSVDVAAGDQTLVFAAVPAGEVWVVTFINAYCSTANPSLLSFRLYQSAVYRTAMSFAYPTAWAILSVRGPFYLKAGDLVALTFNACVLNDDIYGNAFGYKMKVTE